MFTFYLFNARIATKLTKCRIKVDQRVLGAGYKTILEKKGCL